VSKIEDAARAAADAAIASAGGAHAAPPRVNGSEPRAATFGQFLHRMFTTLAHFAADGGPEAERIVADPEFDQALELLMRGHRAGVIADMIAVMGDTLRHRLDAAPPASGPQPSFLPAPNGDAGPVTP